METIEDYRVAVAKMLRTPCGEHYDYFNELDADHHYFIAINRGDDWWPLEGPPGVWWGFLTAEAAANFAKGAKGARRCVVLDGRDPLAEEWVAECTWLYAEENL